MLAKSKLIAFVATAQPEKSLVFYRDILGLTETDTSPHSILFDAHGTSVRVQKVESVSPPPYTVLGWQVPDMMSAVEDLTRKGVNFERYDGLLQDEHGVWNAPGGARVAWFKDPDGNTLSLTQYPPDMVINHGATCQGSRMTK